MAKETLKTLGVYAFLGGVILALIVGIFTGINNQSMSPYMGLITGVMVILGLVVGALNITDKEVNSFVIANLGLSTGSVSLVGLGNLLSASEVTQVVGAMLVTGFTVFGVFVAGAVFVPALKAVYKISKD